MSTLDVLAGSLSRISGKRGEPMRSGAREALEGVSCANSGRP